MDIIDGFNAHAIQTHQHIGAKKKEANATPFDKKIGIDQSNSFVRLKKSRHSNPVKFLDRRKMQWTKADRRLIGINELASGWSDCASIYIKKSDSSDTFLGWASLSLSLARSSKKTVLNLHNEEWIPV